MSELIAWNDSLSVGIDEIDEQHKVPVRLLNDLNQEYSEHFRSDGSKSKSGDRAWFLRRWS